MIPEEAFAPSEVTHIREEDLNEIQAADEDQIAAGVPPAAATVPSAAAAEICAAVEVPAAAEVRANETLDSEPDLAELSQLEEEIEIEALMNLDSRSRSTPNNSLNQSVTVSVSPNEATSSLDSTFHSIMKTPETKTKRTIRRKAINSKGVQLTKCLFPTPDPKSSTESSVPAAKELEKNNRSKPTKPEKSTQKSQNKGSTVTRAKKQISKPTTPPSVPGPSKPRASTSKTEPESWYCFICNEDSVSDMRCCIVCQKYVHEICVGLCEDDFTCPRCE